MYILICLFHLISSSLGIIGSMKAGIICVTVFSHLYIQNSSSCLVIQWINKFKMVANDIVQ